MKLFLPPTFADEAKTLAARKLWAILLGLLASATLLLPLICLIVPGQLKRMLVLVGVLDVGFIALLHWSRKGRTSLAAAVLIVLLMFMAALAAWTGGGVHAPALMSYVMLVGVAGALFGPGAAALTGAACGAIGLILLLAERFGWLPVPSIRHTSTSIWLIFMIVLCISVLLQVVVNWVVRHAAQQAEAHELSRRQFEAALRESEHRYRQLFENAQVGIYRTTPDGKILEANPAMLSMLGFRTLEELTQRNLEADGYAPEYSRAEFRTRLEQGDVRGLEATWHSADGRTVFVRENARAIRDAGGRILFYEGTVEDFTERKQLEDQIRQSGKMQAIGQLAGGVAHDFNNILAGFLLNIGMMEQDPALSPSVRAALREMELQAKRAATLTRRLLLFSRRQVMATKRQDLRELLDELAAMLRRIIGENYELRIDSGAVPVWIDADAGMIDQMIMNLCVNARDAMADGGPIVVRVREVELTEAEGKGRAGRFARLQVIDTGCGISDATMKRLFEPFFTTKDVHKGTGLGLATVYNVVQQHSGWIDVQSAPGSGSTFIVHLPTCEAPADRTPSLSAAPAKGGTETVLLVEDEAAVRLPTIKLLEHLGYRVLAAESGPAALQLWQTDQAKIAILLTDMVLPDGMTGIDLAMRLKTEKPALRIVVCSGYNAELVSNRLDKAIGAAYLTKPFTAETLAATIRRCLEA